MNRKLPKLILFAALLVFSFDAHSQITINVPVDGDLTETCTEADETTATEQLSQSEIEVCEEENAESYLASLTQPNQVKQKPGDCDCRKKAYMSAHCCEMAKKIRACTTQKSSLVQAMLGCLACRESTCDPTQKTGSYLGLFQISSDIWDWCQENVKNNSAWSSAGCASKNFNDGAKDPCCAAACAEAKILDGGICIWQVAKACMDQVDWTPPGGENCGGK